MDLEPEEALGGGLAMELGEGLASPLSDMPEPALGMAMDMGAPAMAASLDAGLAEIPPSPQPVAPAATPILPQGPFLKIPVTVQVVLGSRRMPLSEVMALGPGSVVVLEQELSQPVSLQVNGNEVARGTLGIVDEKTGQLGITLTAIAAQRDAAPA